MRISKVTIRNILGIEELEFDAGAFNAFTGGNEQGKTSALNAVKSALGRDGDDATLLRNGAERGEIVVVMDDDTVITKTVTSAGAKVAITGPEGKVTATASMLRGLTDAMSVNPVDFIRSGDTPADKRQRLQWLLECLPVELDRERLEKIAGASIRVASPEWRAFDQLEAIRQTIFDDRTSTNRAITEKNGSVNQLRQTLPDDEEGVSGDPETIERTLTELDDEHRLALTGVAERLTTYERESGERVDAIRGKYRTEREELEAKLKELNDAESVEVEKEREWMRETTRKAEDKKRDLSTDHAKAREPISATLTAIRAGANAIAKAAQTRAHIKTFEDSIRDLEEDAKRMSDRLDQLQAYKSDLLANIPIDGLTVDDGEIYRNGVPFNRLNTAQQVEMAVAIAKLRASRAGIICVDGIENLDTPQYEAFREKAVDSGLQLFVTRVTDGGLAVETV